MIHGERAVEVEGSAARCYEIAADLERAHEWQPGLREVEVLERDADGRALVVATEVDAKVKVIRARLRFAFSPPGHIGWVQEEGDLKSLDGSWRFAELGAERARATYALAADPGRMLGLLLRGPAEARVRDFLLGAAEGLKAHVEGSNRGSRPHR
jgi:ribosome-associated toxin RatA of RatAB toxin-antitoxin module